MTFIEPVEKIGPGTPAGQVLRQYWQPVALSRGLEKGKAQPLRALGEELTLYRGQSGKAHIIGARCAHRYTWLHTGWVEDDCLRCFYHGWMYDGTGQCVEQPYEKNKRFTEKVRIPGYPVEEYAGLVFVYMGEGDPPPLPRYPELDDPAVEPRAGIRPPGVWPINYFQMVENSLDPVHTAFVHRESEPFWREVPEVAVKETDFGLEMTAVRSGKPRRTYLHFPNLMHITVYLDPERDDTESDHFLWHVPIDDENSMFVSATAVRKELVGGFSKAMAGRIMTESSASELMQGTRRPQSITEEDYVAMVGQGTYADRTNERLGTSDVGVIALRRLWRRAIDELEPRPAGTLRSDRREFRPSIPGQD
jgi:5,5'-dehydrodivanillate O-demethylase